MLTDRGERRHLTLLVDDAPAPEALERPRTRGDCENGVRPCPWASCRYSLVLDVNPKTGFLTVHQDVESDEPRETCALDVADRGGETLEVIAVALGTVRERIRQIEADALRKMRTARPGAPSMTEHAGEGTTRS